MNLHKLFSTADYPEKNSFDAWYELIVRRVVPLEITRIGDRPFSGSVKAADLGSLLLTHVSATATRASLTSTAVKRSNKAATVTFVLMRAGAMTLRQEHGEAVLRAGDIAMVDHRPTSTIADDDGEAFYIDLPIDRIERVLGPTRLYSALTVGTGLASTNLVTSFFNQLVAVHEDLTPETLERMSSIGIDLLVASISERLAQDVPKSLYGTVVVQRAKAYVEANLGDPTLDPPQLAAAVGVSVRRLQELFRERDRHVSDWIWQRRLEAAANRLSDPGHGHLSIGTLAYGCGFTSQAHFSRRFKDCYGMTPSEYRDSAYGRP